MSLIGEARTAPSALQAALSAGIEDLSNRQTVSFQSYTKSVFTDDGYVFWVASGTKTEHLGSLHQFTEKRQEEDQTLAVNKILFTSEEEITTFNTVDSQTLLVGSWTVDGVELQVVFNTTGTIYRQAGIWHYAGDAVYPALKSQLIASEDDLPVGPIAGNSLPLFLSQDSYASVYPSYLVPDNAVPPYVSVHIEPDSTEVIGQFPQYGWPGVTQPNSGASPLHKLPSTQLLKDKVKLTLYGFTSQLAIQYLNSLMDYSLVTDDFGFCNSPVIVDDKRTQVELSALAMKKHINIVVSYYQSTADAVARRLILSASCGVTIKEV